MSVKEDQVDQIINAMFLTSINELRVNVGIDKNQPVWEGMN